MRKFAFRLDAVLAVRRLREREAQRKVGAKRAELARLDELDRQTRAEISAEQRRMIGEQAGVRVDAVGLVRGRAWVAHLRRQMLLRHVQRGQLQQELQKLLAELVEARRQTRMIEKLRERRWQEYRRARRIAEQNGSDELARQLLLLEDAPGVDGREDLYG